LVINKNNYFKNVIIYWNEYFESYDVLNN